MAPTHRLFLALVVQTVLGALVVVVAKEADVPTLLVPVLAVLALGCAVLGARWLGATAIGLAPQATATSSGATAEQPTELERARRELASMADELRRNQALQEQDAERFRRFVEYLPIGVIMVDDHGHILLANTRSEDLFGYAHDDLVGRSIEQLVPARFRSGHPGLRGAFMARPAARPMGAGRDLFAVRSDGSEFPVEIGLNPVPATNGTTVIVSIVDISERQAATDFMRSALSEKEMLLREVYHRVKNNLQVLVSLIGLQQRRAPAGVAREVLRDSGARVQAMALAHEMLYRSPQLAEVDFAAYGDALVTQVCAAHGIDPSLVTIDKDLAHARLEIDRAIPLGLILNELLANCLKHAFPEGRRGRIAISLRAEDDGGLHLRVADDGVGLPPPEARTGSSSLGLLLVNSLVGQLGGHMDTDGTHGTTVDIRFGGS